MITIIERMIEFLEEGKSAVEYQHSYGSYKNEGPLEMQSNEEKEKRRRS